MLNSWPSHTKNLTIDTKYMQLLQQETIYLLWVMECPTVGCCFSNDSVKRTSKEEVLLIDVECLIVGCCFSEKSEVRTSKEEGLLIDINYLTVGCCFSEDSEIRTSTQGVLLIDVEWDVASLKSRRKLHWLRQSVSLFNVASLPIM